MGHDRPASDPATLQEPHIVPLLAAGTTSDGLPFYTMPFVRGDSLRALLRIQPVALADAVGILRNIAQALAYAHDRGIVHRDIKPENVLLSSGTAVVADFGIAKALSASTTQARGDTLTSAGTSIGTPAYMAPEQAVGDTTTDYRADLYAWGVVAYETLAGVHPFGTHTSPHALVAAHISEAPRPIHDVQPSIPRGVADLVMQCLEKDPQRRPSSAAVLLTRLAASTSVSQESTSITARSSIRRRRWLRAAAALATIAVVLAGVTWRNASIASGDVDELHSIAVMPFTNLTSDNATVRLGEGVAETLMNALSKVPGLTVSARTSAFSIREQESDVRSIGRQLNVESVLTGSIQRAGDQLRIAARVIRIVNDSILWSETFDRPASDIFAVQDEVARAVTAALRPRLDVASAAMQGVSGTQSTVAYNAYILGRYYWNQRTTDGMLRATKAFQQAIAADSSYAQAWSGLADSYSLSIPGEFNVAGFSRDTFLVRAERAARRAIALAPNLADGHVSLGQALGVLGRYSDAIVAFERGVALNPSYATGHQWLAYSLLDRGLWEAGIREMEIAHRLDPLAPIITLSLAVAYDGVDRFADAEPLYADGLAQAPDQWYGWRFRMAHDLAQRNFTAARAALQESAKDSLHPLWPAWRDLARGPADSATWAGTAARLLGDGSWDLGVALARWLHGEARSVDIIAGSLRTRSVFGGWQLQAILGPRLRADPRVRSAFGKVGVPIVNPMSRAP